MSEKKYILSYVVVLDLDILSFSTFSSALCIEWIIYCQEGIIASLLQFNLKRALSNQRVVR